MNSAKTLRAYQDKWVAFTPERKIIASGDTVDVVIKLLEKLDAKDTTLSYIPSAARPLAPYVTR